MAPNRYRILQVITPSHIGGAERHLEWLAPRLRERGHEVHILCNRRSRALAEFRRDLKKVDFQVEDLPIGGKLSLRALAALWHAVRRTRADVTHSHLSSASWQCGWLDGMGRCPSVGHVQGFTSAQWHRKQSQLIACSQAVKEHIIAQGIPGARITVLPNPVDPADLKPRRTAAEVRAEFGADERTPVTGSFAHLSEKKGWRELLQAVPHVLRAHPNAQFWCVGEGVLRQELQTMAAEGGFEENVKFLGFRRDVADLMNAIDVMALPSHREPFGIVYVEAALLGKPAIACAAGGAPDVVQDGVTGLLVPPRDSNALAGALTRIFEDRAAAAQLGAAGRAYALEHFGWDPYLERLQGVYEKAVGRKQ